MENHPSTFLYINNLALDMEKKRMPYLRMRMKAIDVVMLKQNAISGCVNGRNPPVILCDLSDHLLKLERWIACGLA